MSLVGKTPEERTWNYLVKVLGNQYGAAGVIGNLYAESGIIFNRVETLCLNRLKEYTGKTWTNATYTAAVDNGTIGRKEFLNPLENKQYGYGLCQWTSPSRKAGLYDLVKSRKVSIADEEAQLDWMISELTASYKTVHSTLKAAKSVKEASDIFLLKFEIPADRSDAVKDKRAGYGQKYYDKYANTKEATTVSADYSKYMNSTGTHYISNSGSDENGSYHGGAAGDQTGNEWCLRSWYNRPWNCVLRYEKDPRVGKLLAELGCAAALNNKVGYDQYQRETYWSQLQKCNYDPSKITVACEADCSAGVIANIKAVGHILGIDALKNLNATYTGNMRSGLRAAGFTLLTASKYLTGYGYLLPGDVLLNDEHHTATNITKGAYAVDPNGSGSGSGSTAPVTPNPTSYTGKYVESKAYSPANKSLYKMICTGNGVNVRTSPTTKESNISAYVKQLFKGDEVEYCDKILGKDGLTWLFVKIKTKNHPKGYVHDFVCADYFKKA